ncbi:MAG: glycoside hydrolase family 9 protein [Kineosporiaceae bacterium]
MDPGSVARRRGALTALALTATGSLAVAGLTIIPTSAALAEEGAEQISNGTFETGTTPWTTYGTVGTKIDLVDGAACATADEAASGGAVWDAAITYDGITALVDTGYELTFRAKASDAVTVFTGFQMGSDPYTQVAAGQSALSTEWTTFTYNGTSPATPADPTAPTIAFDNGQLVFQIGGKGPVTVCIDDVSLKGGVEPPKYEPETGPIVRVNQVGYLTKGPKLAVVVSDEPKGLPYTLNLYNNKSLKPVVFAKGTTVPAGLDPSSGQKVHTIDFSKTVKPGTYSITVAGEESYKFRIGTDIYSQLRKDAMTLYYTQRSGIAIDNKIVPGYGRAAGHIGVAPNTGDKSVSCAAPIAAYDDWTCTSKFDVSGGWYDAGDQGKYVVNGGISVAQLLGTWERSQTAKGANKNAYGDKTLRLPEAGNKLPDLLDEVKWELDWFLKMQVPTTTTDAGLTPYKGMVFHKLHDAKWTGLPMDPAKDAEVRELHRPSTAATLNFAAALAQGARVYAKYDKAYSTKLLDAAKVAYAAAKANPKVYASTADATGGGAYEDNNVTDEFYWAATELYLTTKDAAYSADVLASPLHLGNAQASSVFDVGGFGWQSVAALARLDQATVPNALPNKAGIKKSVTAAADNLVTLAKTQPYAQPLTGWVWGSTSNLLNNMQILGTAYDLTKKVTYLNATLRGMDWVLGRNALNNSYVTGYGTVYSKNQHSRWYAKSLDAKLPNPPAGTIAGGPNVGLQDPVAASKLTGCVGQMCYIDDIESYSTNELTINWNAPLVWVSSFLADQKAGLKPVG